MRTLISSVTPRDMDPLHLQKVTKKTNNSFLRMNSSLLITRQTVKPTKRKQDSLSKSAYKKTKNRALNSQDILSVFLS